MNISNARLRELEKKEQILQSMQETQAIQPFVDKFINRLGLLAATTPYEKWGNAFILAFKATEEEMPTAAYIYKTRLPKNA